MACYGMHVPAHSAAPHFSSFCRSETLAYRKADEGCAVGHVGQSAMCLPVSNCGWHLALALLMVNHTGPDPNCSQSLAHALASKIMAPGKSYAKTMVGTPYYFAPELVEVRWPLAGRGPALDSTWADGRPHSACRVPAFA